MRRPLRPTTTAATAAVVALLASALLVGTLPGNAVPSQAAPIPRLPDAAPSPLPGRDGVLFTFVSMPDFFNADIGNVRGLPRAAGLPAGVNSVNRSWRRAMDVVLDGIQAEHPQAVLVAGDLVEGHWGEDVDGTGVFGPVGTHAQKLRAVTRAGNLYYRQWAARFARRGLTVYPAVGDHEIGDNPWHPGGFKYRAFPTYKQVWVKHFTRTAAGTPRYWRRPVGTPYADTAYAVRIANTLIVTIDVFARTGDGVRATVTRGQRRWLNRLIPQARRNGVKHVIVQGHTPVLGPVRQRNSSGLMLEGGASSPLWQLLKRHKVDLYLCGEVHDMTTRVNGVVQVSHGGLLAHADANYLLGRVYRDRIELELKEFKGGRDYWQRRLWATTLKRPAARVTMVRNPARVGTLVIDKSGSGPRRLLAARGYLKPPRR
ncbi:MAG: metallophosphoesterase family protein [Actinomycetes bacterium]